MQEAHTDCLSPTRTYGQVNNGFELLVVATPPIEGNAQCGRSAHHYEPTKRALVCAMCTKQLRLNRCCCGLLCPSILHRLA